MHVCVCLVYGVCVCVTGIYHTHILFVRSDERDMRYTVGAVTLSCYVARKMIYGEHNFSSLPLRLKYPLTFSIVLFN